ncbi:MAG: biotin synthase [Wolinella sp.]
MSEVFLCSICNVSSGGCAEDCAYCTQSAKYSAEIDRYRQKPVETILEEARCASAAGALGFCLVTAGRGLDSKKVSYISEAAHAIKESKLPLHLIACCGSADRESLAELKKSGVDSYNHNLETAKSFFSNICTTHTWEERYQTCEYATEVGLGLMCGGIFGLGEGWNERIELLHALQTLKPHAVPINFFIPNKSLPLELDVMSREEALECIKLTREYLPNVRLMVAGGREKVFGRDQKAIFDTGVNAIVLGDYLTTKGNAPIDDIEMIHSYGLKLADICH